MLESKFCSSIFERCRRRGNSSDRRFHVRSSRCCTKYSASISSQRFEGKKNILNRTDRMNDIVVATLERNCQVYLFYSHLLCVRISIETRRKALIDLLQFRLQCARRKTWWKQITFKKGKANLAPNERTNEQTDEEKKAATISKAQGVDFSNDVHFLFDFVIVGEYIWQICTFFLCTLMLVIQMLCCLHHTSFKLSPFFCACFAFWCCRLELL